MDRRGRGYLALDVDYVLKGVITGELKVFSNKPLTASAISDLLVESEQLDKEEKPSTGAITNILKKWETYGYIETETHPYRFVDFTEEGRIHGYEALEKKYKELLIPEVKEIEKAVKTKHREKQIQDRMAIDKAHSDALDALKKPATFVPDLPF